MSAHTPQLGSCPTRTNSTLPFATVDLVRSTRQKELRQHDFLYKLDPSSIVSLVHYLCIYCMDGSSSVDNPKGKLREIGQNEFKISMYFSMEITMLPVPKPLRQMQELLMQVPMNGTNGMSMPMPMQGTNGMPMPMNGMSGMAVPGAPDLFSQICSFFIS